MNQPVKNLGAAIILSAFDDLIAPRTYVSMAYVGKQKTCSYYSVERVREVARAWIFEDEDLGYPISLKTACEMCEIPVSSVRKIAKTLLN